MPTLIPEQLKAQIDRWRGRRGWETERVFAIRTDFPYAGAGEISCDGLDFNVAECRSDLEARDLLLGLEDDEGKGLLLLMRTDEERLGEDVRARFAGRTVHSLDQREVLKQIYQAVAIDPRISNDEALLDALVMAGAGGAVRKAPGGSLDLDFAWSVILRQPDLMNQRPDLVEILRWSLDPERWSSVQALDRNLVPSFFDWVAERAGKVARCLESLFVSDQANLYLPLGLVAGDLFDKGMDDAEGAADAKVRFENYLNGQSIKPSDAATWGRAAREVLDKRQPEERERMTGQVDAILEGIRALPIAAAFTWSKQGFRDRWLRFADDIDRLGRRKWESGSRAVHQSLLQLQNHALAPLHASRLSRAEMAARLAGYEANFAAHRKPAAGLVAAARDFAVNDSFIDWARFSLAWGDPFSDVAEVYGRLAKRMAKARIEAQTSFGKWLCHWHADNENGPAGVVPIESVTAECIAPLAAQRPVLLLVMDGMNYPAFHQLSRSLAGLGWEAQCKSGDDFPSRVLSALPSITDVSRWALFAGKVEVGKRASEVVVFRENQTLADVRGRGKPLLFTKSDLVEQDSGALSVKVRDALLGSDHRVVAIVINAIDDQLKTGGQLSLDWEVKSIGILPAILEAAMLGERCLALTSDHGHILEHENTRAVNRAAEGETRYRYGGAEDEGELVFTGSRIKAATGRDSVVLPVTETLRYGQKAAGYHGGACDLEVVVPLAVFSGQGDEIDGYQAIDPTYPAWWSWRRVFEGEPQSKAVPMAPAKPAARKKKGVTDVDQLPLFVETAPPSGDSPQEPAWLEAFFSSPVFEEQERLLGRAAPSREHLRKVLASLAANDGTMLTTALGQAISEPGFRLQGILSRVARFTNVDSYPILEVDRDSDTLRLNRKLLASQFQLTI